MKNSLRNMFSPLLNIFESGDQPLPYKKSHRTTLIIVGSLFLMLSVGTTIGAYFYGQLGAALPILIFFTVGATCLVVGILGSDHAVSKIWGGR